MAGSPIKAVAELHSVSLPPAEDCFWLHVDKKQATDNTEESLMAKMMGIPVDMVILCPAMIPRADAAGVTGRVSITQKATDIVLERHIKLEPQDIARDGVFVAGCRQVPEDAPEAASQCDGCLTCGEMCGLEALRVVEDG